MRGWKQRKEGELSHLPFRSLTFSLSSHFKSVQSLTLGVPYFTTNQQFYSTMQDKCYTYMHALHYSYGMMQYINNVVTSTIYYWDVIIITTLTYLYYIITPILSSFILSNYYLTSNYNLTSNYYLTTVYMLLCPSSSKFPT